MNKLIKYIVMVVLASVFSATAYSHNLSQVSNGDNESNIVSSESEYIISSIDCPPGGIAEGEPDCGMDYIDNYNGGCNSEPPVFSYITSGDTICGISGIYISQILSYRDTDWYEIEITQNCELTWCAVAEFPLLLFIIDAGSGNCEDYVILTWDTAVPYDTLFLSYNVSPGIYWLWVGPSYFQDYMCPKDYVCWVKGCEIELCCDVDMIPDEYPIELPPGGSFGLTGHISNPTPDPVLTDVGIMINTPGYGIYGPLQTFFDIPLNPGETISAHMFQYVPYFAPPGIYDYIAYCGDYPDNICDSVLFQFTVTGSAGNYRSNIAEGKTPDLNVGEWILEGGWNKDNATASLPTDYILLNSYPNPFNAQTNITFGLPEASEVTLTIYNLMGREVVILFNGYQEAGYHTVTWNASQYSSGIYFYRLTDGDQVFTKRMTLLK